MSRTKQEPARQHGAMEFTEPPTDLDAVRRYHLGRVREQLARADCAGILLYDPLNLRYATDVTKMPVWSMHNENRYAFIATDGPVILFEYNSAPTSQKTYPRSTKSARRRPGTT